MSEPMTLPDDIATAFKHLADYLDAAIAPGSGRDVFSNQEGKMFPVPAKGRELEGVWQTWEYTVGLHELAEECRRLMLLAATAPAVKERGQAPRRILRFQNLDLPVPDKKGDGKAGSIPTLIAFADDGTLWVVHAAEGGCEYQPMPNLPS